MLLDMFDLHECLAFRLACILALHWVRQHPAAEGPG